jgi:hypothetical protein
MTRWLIAATLALGANLLLLLLMGRLVARSASAVSPVPVVGRQVELVRLEREPPLPRLRPKPRRPSSAGPRHHPCRPSRWPAGRCAWRSRSRI